MISHPEVSGLEDVFEGQARNGAIPSFVNVGEATFRDENCFVTSLALIELAKVPPFLVADRRPEIERALDFVERCASPDLPGAYRFYAEGSDIVRAPIPTMRPDADDTALAWLALVLHRRRSRDEMAEGSRALALGTVAYLRGDEPRWTMIGASRTWLGEGAYRNPVDVCVNANVAGFYALAGETWRREYAASVALVSQAVAVTGGVAEYLRTLAPFYADFGEIGEAVERAVDLGALELRPVLNRLTEVEDDSIPPDRPICCNAHGRPLWRSPALQAARTFRRRHRRSTTPPEGVKQCS